MLKGTNKHAYTNNMRRVLFLGLCAGSVCAALFFIVNAAGAVTVPVGAVVLSELMWDGTEYVELRNTTDTDLALAGWTLTRQQAGGEIKMIVQFDEEDVVAAGDHFLIEKTEETTTVAADKVVSVLTLVNTGELVTLLDADDRVIDSANQLGPWFAGQNTEDGVAMERGEDGDDGIRPDSWHHSVGDIGGRNGTPGAANSVGPINHSPEAVVDPSAVAVTAGTSVSFSAEDSLDPDGDELTYAWAFGDEGSAVGVSAAHVYMVAGTYTVQLTVSDEEFDDEALVTVTVAIPVYATTVIVNEFLANPIGSDTAAEFIELKNAGNAAVDLSGWRLDDVFNEGSASYVMPGGTMIGAGSVKAFSRTETKLALNNGGDSVRLLSPDGIERSLFSYSDTVAEGQSYNYTESGRYVLSTTITEGKENIITAPSDDLVGDEEDDADGTVPNTHGSVAGVSVKAVKLQDIRDEDLGTFIETEGVVSVPPGVFGEKIIYVAGSGVQIYLYDETFPQLSLGNRIGVRGELTSYLEEMRLKVARSSDITVMGMTDTPIPHLAATKDIREQLEGTLITISGSVARTEGSTFYVDDGSGEAKVFIKDSAQIDKPVMRQGTVVTVTGVVSQTKSGYRILPRFQEDVRLGTVAGLTSFPRTGDFLVFLSLTGFIVVSQFYGGWRAGEPLSVTFLRFLGRHYH